MAGSKVWRRTTSALANLLLLSVSLIVMAAAGELLLRLALPPPIHWKYPQEHYLYDLEIGVQLAPNQRAFTHDKPVEINSTGIRDVEYSGRAPAGIKRVVALGDSQTFGNGLTIADTWPKQLESKLNDRYGHGRWQVLNCGIPGTDTWQHEVILKRMMDAYKPDLAILAFYVNDVTDRHNLEPRDVLAATNTFGKRLAYLLKESALLLFIRDAIASVQQRFRPSRGFEIEQAIVTGAVHPAVEKGWRQADHSLAAMKATINQRGAAFLVVILPRRDQVSGRQPSRGYQNRLREILERHGIPHVDALGTMQLAYSEYGRSMFIPWDGHHSAIANRVIADELTDFLLGTRAARPIR
jgi:hypothetical protein